MIGHVPRGILRVQTPTPELARSSELLHLRPGRHPLCASSIGGTGEYGTS
ncbi:hypothetical protein [Deinococcus ruber]|nr:hypothetical protein [Deinococcus ruber]